MGGTSSTSQKQDQSGTSNGTSNVTQSQNGTTGQMQTSASNPWEQSLPALQGILGQLNPLVQNSGLTGAQSGALDSLSANGQNQNAGQIGSLATSLLNGGGANNQSGAVNNAFQTYQQQINPVASNTNYDPMQTPGLAQQLQTIQSDVGNSVNGQFAAAGRDFSGMNQQAYGRGVAQGLAPVITNQYNQNRDAQQAAAGNLYNAGNTTAGLLTGMNQQGLANQLQGVQTSNDALAARNSGANATLQAEAQRTGIPIQQLGLLAQIGIPIAGLGSTSSGTSNGTTSSNGLLNGITSGQTTGHAQTDGTSTMSGADQFAKIAGGVGSLGKLLFG